MTQAVFDPFGTASWPMELGRSSNTNTAPVFFPAAVKTLWSVPIGPIDQALVSGIVLAEDGCVFLSAGETLSAIEPGGSIRWRHEADGWVGRPSVLAEGSVLATEDGGQRFVARDQATGRERWHIGSERWSAHSPAVTAGGQVLIQSLGNAAGKDVRLVCLSPAGERLWHYDLSARGDTILTLPELIIAVDGSYLAGLDFEGRRLWLANRFGFIDGSGADQMQRLIEHEEIHTPPMHLAGSQILLGASWWDGHGVLILDLASKSVSVCGGWDSPAILFRPPLAVTTMPAPRLAGCLLADLLVCDLSGELVFEHRLPLNVMNIVGDAAGNIVASTSVDRDYWEKYRDPYALHEACGLTCFDPLGQERFHWSAPGPLAHPLAVGKEGELYCVSEGRLWAVGQA